MPRIWLANMAEAQTSAFTPPRNYGVRYLWQLNNNDIFVTKYSLDVELIEYVKTTTQKTFKVIYDIKQLKNLSNYVLDPYIQTPNALALAKQLGIPMLGTPPELVKQGLIIQLNSKSQFKLFCDQCDINTPAHKLSHSNNELHRFMAQMCPTPQTKIVLKKDISASGKGILSNNCANLTTAINNHWAGATETIIIDKFENFDLILGALVEITDYGLNFIGVDKQIIEDNHWCGMEYPFTADKTLIKQIKKTSLKLAQLFFDMGARGWVNFDFGVTKDKTLYALETNFRHNGMSTMINAFATKNHPIRYYNNYQRNNMTLKEIIAKNNQAIVIDFTADTHGLISFTSSNNTIGKCLQ